MERIHSGAKYIQTAVRWPKSSIFKQIRNDAYLNRKSLKNQFPQCRKVSNFLQHIY